MRQLTSLITYPATVSIVKVPEASLVTCFACQLKATIETLSPDILKTTALEVLIWHNVV